MGAKDIPDRVKGYQPCCLHQDRGSMEHGNKSWSFRKFSVLRSKVDVYLGKYQKFDVPLDLNKITGWKLAVMQNMI